MVKVAFLLIALFAGVDLAIEAAYTCTAGTGHKLKSSDPKCSNGVCTDSKCCECDTTKCCSFSGTCAADKYKDPAKTGTDAAACCVDKTACSGYTCPDTHQDKSTKSTDKVDAPSSNVAAMNQGCCITKKCSAISCGTGERKAKSPDPGDCPATGCTYAHCCTDATKCSEYKANGGTCSAPTDSEKAGTTTCTAGTCSSTCCEHTPTDSCYAKQQDSTYTCGTGTHLPSSKYKTTGNTNATCCTDDLKCSASSSGGGGGGTTAGAVSTGIASSVLLLAALAAV